MTERPEGLDRLLDHVAEALAEQPDIVDVAEGWSRELAKENPILTATTGVSLSYVLYELVGRIRRYENNKPSWLHGTPEDVDAWLRDLIPDDKRLAFYRWVGTLAVREAVADAKEQIGNDPVPIEHRYYSPDNVDEILDLMTPDDGDIGYPSVLPVGRPFCDDPSHTHTDGGSRLPSCRLGWPEE